MMEPIVTDTIGECWKASMRRVLEAGTPCHDEDVTIHEVLGLSVRMNEPRLTDPVVERFGDPWVVEHTLAKFARGAVMANRPFTYGQAIYAKNGVDQFEWMVERLTRKPESKSATICLLTEGVRNANLPCLVTLDAKIRVERLTMQFFFRSQNIVGRQYANFLAIARLQKDLADRLGLRPGFIAGYIASAHIYDYDVEYARAILAGEDVRIADRFYEAGPKSIRSNKLFREPQAGAAPQ